MQVIRAVRYLTVVGASVVVLSFPLRWAVVPSPTGTPSGTNPPAILFLGLALLILALVPATTQLARVLPVILVGSSVVAVFVILWTSVETVLQVVRLQEASLGPGPVLAVIGAALFIIGSIAFIQVIAAEEAEIRTYRVTGIQDSTSRSSDVPSDQRTQ